jgi:hypothetical protein
MDNLFHDVFYCEGRKKLKSVKGGKGLKGVKNVEELMNRIASSLTLLAKSGLLLSFDGYISIRYYVARRA